MGLLLGIPLFVVGRFPLYVCAALLLPLIADGFLQLLTRYESNNGKRLVTGILFGYGLVNLFLLTTAATFRWGVEMGNRLH